MSTEKRLFATLMGVSIIFVIKLTGGFITNSLALQGDAWHLFTDILSLGISYIAASQAHRSADYNYTFGYCRYSILASLVNNLSLIIVSLWLFYQAIQRFLHPTPIHPQGMLIIGIIGLICNALIAFNLRTTGNNLNIKSAFLHFIGDALADLGVIIGSLVIYFTGYQGVDTLLSGLLGCMILGSALKMSRETLLILLERVPARVRPQEVIQELDALSGVNTVRDLHIWSLTGDYVAMCAVVCIKNVTIAESEKLLHSIQQRLKERFGIVHTTIQFETVPCKSCCHDKEVRKQLCINNCPPDHAEQFNACPTLLR